MLKNSGDAITVSLFKKGNKADCRNYYDFSLLSILEKILAHVILKCPISSVSEESLPEYHMALGQTTALSTWSSHLDKFRINASSSIWASTLSSLI